MKKLLIIGVLSGSTIVYLVTTSKTTLPVQDPKPSIVSNVVEAQSSPKNFEKFETPLMPKQTIAVEPSVNSNEQTNNIEPAAPKIEPTESELAREALKTVGIDPVAEKVWCDVINNPETPAKDRKNLIEDLDTTGFKSHKYPTADDIPLIQNRLVIIEKYAPTAMDTVNAKAFQEAKKDLTKMLGKASAPIQ
jgi:hypothetical protein